MSVIRIRLLGQRAYRLTWMYHADPWRVVRLIAMATGATLIEAMEIHSFVLYLTGEGAWTA